MSRILFWRWTFMMLFVAGLSIPPVATVQASDTGDTTIKVMSFNIRLETPVDKENGWPFRKAALLDEIVANAPDLLGVQEAKWGQMEYLIAGLSGYGWIGVGRDDGKQGGEFSAVFYKKERFEAVDSGTFWLSQTPDVPGSLGWDAACRRVVSWGKFQVKGRPGCTFVFANTHFDHKGRVARAESAKLIQLRLRDIAGKLPLMVSGDFNCLNDSDVYKILTTGPDGKGGFIDSNPVAKERFLPVSRTYHAYGQIPGDTQRIIDYIFVNDKVRVDRFSICPEKRGDTFTSDHNAIVAECRID